MAKKLIAVVMLTHPRTGVVETFYPGDTPPAWAAKAITNPNAWGAAGPRGRGVLAQASTPAETSEPTEETDEDATGAAAGEDGGTEDTSGDAGAETGDGGDGEPEQSEGTTAGVERPPASGPGSDKGAWRRYAEHLGLTVDPGASRSDIQAAVEAAEQH